MAAWDKLLSILGMADRVAHVDINSADDVNMMKTAFQELCGDGSMPPSRNLKEINDTFDEFAAKEIIKTNTTFNIGTGGDYGDLQSAINDLCLRAIKGGVIVTLKLIAGFSPVNVVQQHPQSGQIGIDFNGNDYRVASGNAFQANSGFILFFRNTGANMTVSTASNGTGSGFLATRNGTILMSLTAIGNIKVGASGYGFLSGLEANCNGVIQAPYIQCQYNTRGTYCILGGVISAQLGQINNNATGLLSSNCGYTHAVNVRLLNNTVDAVPAVNTEGTANTYICWSAP